MPSFETYVHGYNQHGEPLYEVPVSVARNQIGDRQVTGVFLRVGASDFWVRLDQLNWAAQGV